MDPVPADASSKYAAIVGDKRGAYYARQFSRFAGGSLLSWNWAAFFGTLAWLRYRKLRGWSWAYFFVSTPVLLGIAWLFAVGGDACARALDPSVVPKLALVLAALGWIVPPLFANRLYFRRVQVLAARDPATLAAKETGTGGVAGALVLQGLVLLLVAPSAGYSDYRTRARASEGIEMLGALKTPLAEYLADKGHLPARLDELGVQTSSQSVGNVVMEPTGKLKATFGDRAGVLSGHSLFMVPTRTGDQITEWTCGSDDLPNQCLPSACRRR